MIKIYNIFLRYKYKLLCIYLFMVVTEIIILIHPYVLGKTIDGLILGNYYWLILLSITYFLPNFFNYKRMVFDTKVYTEIYNDIVFNILKKSNIDDSTKIARTDMAHEIVGVLEGYVHYYIATIITVIGSIGFIYAFNSKIGLVVTFSFVFILLAAMLFYKKIKQAIKVRNNQYENKVKSFELGGNDLISFFTRRRKILIFESNLQGKNWLIIGIIKNIFLLASVVLLVTTTKSITIGNILMVYSYINNFLISLLSVPVAIEMFSRIGDILKRVI